MAEVSKKSFKTKKKTPDNLTCELVFDGGLLSNTRASLVIELIKYFMFERHQIPQPFEHVKRDMKMKEEKIAAGPRTQPTDLQPSELDTNTSKGNGRKRVVNGGKSVRTLRNMITERKIKSIIENLEMLFDNLEKSFVLCPEISQIVIILGGTIVSPKETFVIKLPQLSPDADNLVFKTCVKAMFRQIITQDLLCDMKALTPTNMSVLLHAPRECNMEWFIPNHTFKFPVRGRFFTYNCTCKQPVVMNHDLTHEGNPLEISGIDFLDSIDIDMAEVMLEDMSLSELLSQRVSLGHSRRSLPNTAEKMDSELGESKLIDEDDRIWFQSPVNVKGFRDPLNTKH